MRSYVIESEKPHIIMLEENRIEEFKELTEIESSEIKAMIYNLNSDFHRARDEFEEGEYELAYPELDKLIYSPRLIMSWKNFLGEIREDNQYDTLKLRDDLNKFESLLNSLKFNLKTKTLEDTEELKAQIIQRTISYQKRLLDFLLAHNGHMGEKKHLKSLEFRREVQSVIKESLGEIDHITSLDEDKIKELAKKVFEKLDKENKLDSEAQNIGDISMEYLFEVCALPNVPKGIKFVSALYNYWKLKK